MPTTCPGKAGVQAPGTQQRTRTGGKRGQQAGFPHTRPQMSSSHSGRSPGCLGYPANSKRKPRVHRI